MSDAVNAIQKLILDAKAKAQAETCTEPEPELTTALKWPVECTVGPGLEGAIACSTDIGYVNGSKGWLVYRGYDIFDLCAYCSFEEVSFLLLQGKLPNEKQLKNFKKKIARYGLLTKTMREIMASPIDGMNTMAALRLATNLMRRAQTYVDKAPPPHEVEPIGADEDSIPEETPPRGDRHAVYEFKKKGRKKPEEMDPELRGSEGLESCIHLIAGLNTIVPALARIRGDRLPIEPDPELSIAGNLLYTLRGTRPTPAEERIMDVALILHADHGMNASTFAAMVVASTLSDIYFSIGAGIAALNGPLHGGANEQVIKTLNEIGSAEKVGKWYQQAREAKQKIPGFGHRVYKAYDPRARVLGPLAHYLAEECAEIRPLLSTATALEHEVVSALGEKKGIFPNVDFYSGIVYTAMGIPTDLYTPLFAASRVSGWTARVLEYLRRNRIFRPRAIYTGPFGLEVVPIDKR